MTPRGPPAQAAAAPGWRPERCCTPELPGLSNVDVAGEWVYDPLSGELWWLVGKSEGIALRRMPTRWENGPPERRTGLSPRATGHRTRGGRKTTKQGDGSMFTGEYRHSVDAKGRVAIPVRFRAPLGEGAMLARWVDGCAAIFPQVLIRGSGREGREAADLRRAGQGLLPLPLLRLLRGRDATSRDASCCRPRSRSGRVSGPTPSSSGPAITSRSGIRAGGRSRSRPSTRPTRWPRT